MLLIGRSKWIIQLSLDDSIFFFDGEFGWQVTYPADDLIKSNLDSKTEGKNISISVETFFLLLITLRWIFVIIKPFHSPNPPGPTSKQLSNETFHFI